MKLITAIIHPSRLDVVKNALQAFDVHGLTVGPVSGQLAARPHRDLPRRQLPCGPPAQDPA